MPVPPEIASEDVRGVRYFYAGLDGPPKLAGLVARVGAADETLPRRGATHLVEHAALPASNVAGIDFNGMVDTLATVLWAAGDYDRAVQLIVESANKLPDLDAAIIRRERAVLRAEAASRGLSPVNFAAMLRFGARGPGLPHFDEYGLRTLSDEDIAEWARTRFTKSSCALCFTGALPDDLPIELPEGQVLAPPEPEEIPYIDFPCAFGLGAEGKVVASLVGDRTEALPIAAHLAQRRLHDQLRVRSGTTYSVDMYYEPLSKTKAHVVFTADAQEHHTVEARNNLVATLDALADFGPTEEELQAHLDAVDADEADPNIVPAMLFYFAREHLMGKPAETLAQMAAARREVTTARVRDAMAALVPTMLLVLPSGTPLPAGRFDRYPLDAPAELTGRRHRRRRVGRLRRRPTEEVLVVSDDGVALHAATRTTVRFASCAAMLRWDDGHRGLLGDDALYVEIAPEIWEEGGSIVELVDRRVPPEIMVSMDEAVAERDADLVAAEEAWRERDVERARALLEAGLERAPDDARAWRLLSVVTDHLGIVSRALDAADQATRLDPESSWGWRVRATALTRLGRREEGVQDLERALERDPADLGMLADTAFALSNLGEHERALQLGERAIEMHPKSSQAWFAHGWALQAAGSLEEAERSLRRALEIDPDDASWHNNLGWVLLRRGEPREAITHFRTALDKDPRNVARWNLPLAYSLAGDRGQADRVRREQHEIEVAHVRRELESNPGDAMLHVRLSNELEELEDVEGGLAEALRATELDPDNERVVARASVAAMYARDLPTSRTFLARLAEDPELTPESLIVVAWLSSMLGDSDGARQAAARVSGARNVRARAMSAAYAHAAAGDWEPAERELEHAESLRPFDCCVQTWRGLAALERGDHAAAAERLDRAETYAPCRCLARERLAAGVAGQR